MGALVGDIASTLLEYQDMFALSGQKKKKDLIYKSVNLTDSSLFSLISTGIGRNRIQLQALDTQNTSDIPVYTAAKTPIAYIKPLQGKEPIVATIERPVISFATNDDGSAGRNFVVHTKLFYLNIDRIAVSLNNSQIILPYLYAQISDIKKKYGFSHSYKANRHNLENVTLPIPVYENGEFNVEAQEAIAAQFDLVEQLKAETVKKRKQISSIAVDIDLSGYSMIYRPLSEILEPIKGKSVYTRKYGDVHKGDYPVFSASSATPLTHIDTYDYDGEYLSWSTNGFAGTVTVLKGRFSINGDRGILFPKIYSADIRYLRYVLEPVFRQLAKGRKGDRGEDEFTKLYPSMIVDVDIPLPADSNGNISLNVQKEIAAMYDSVEQYRREVLTKLDILIDQRIEY